MHKMREGGILITKIHQLAGRIFSKLLKKYNIEEINPAQGRILFVLWSNDDIPIHELSRKTQLKKSTLTSMLDRLEEKGYIRRVYSNEDRRKILIERTEKDKVFQDLYLKVSSEMTNIFYYGFRDEEITSIEDSLKKILNNLEKYEEEN